MEPVAAASPRLQRLLTARLRRAALVDALALVLIGASILVAALEITARIVVLGWLRPLEILVAVAAASSAVVLYLRSRPSSSAWRATADAMSEDAGIFSAAGGGAAPTRLSPLVEQRAETAAAVLLAEPGPRGPLPARTRLAILGLVAAGAVAALPGIRTCSDDLELRCLQERLVSDVRALVAGAEKTRNAAEKSAFDRAAKTLDGGRLTVESARRLAEELKAVARAQARKHRDLARELAKEDLLRDVAAALRHEDPKALERAIEELAARLAATPPRSQDALEAAASLLRLAASEDDPGLKQALADAGRELAGGNGSGDSGGLRELGRELCRLVRASESVEDIVVSLESASSLDASREYASIRGRPAGAPAPESAGRDGARAGMPAPEELRSMIRPGTPEEAVLARYFALP